MLPAFPRTVALGLPFTIFWAVVAFFCRDGLDFLNYLGDDVVPPKGSRSEQAQTEFWNLFPQKAMQYPFSQGILIVARDPRQHSIWSPEVKELSHLILNGTLGACDELPKSDKNYWLFTGLCWWRQAVGIFLDRDDSQLDVNDAGLISADNQTATIVLLTINIGFGGAGSPGMVAAWNKLQNVIDAWLAEHGDHFTVGSTHEQMLLDAAQKAVIRDFESGDAITIPVAWLLLLYACGPSAVLALVTLPVTLLVSFAVLLQLARGSWLCKDRETWATDGCAQTVVSFPDFAPAVYIDMMIAISFDYTLFLLTRFREELGRGHSARVAVWRALQKAGRVIVTSGLILMLSFVGLTRCSVDVIASIGWGGAVLCATAMAVHITLLPSLLLLLAPCCEHCCTDACGLILGFLFPSPRRGRWRRRGLLLIHEAPAPVDNEPAGLVRSSVGQGEVDLTHSRWVSLGLICRDHRLKLIAAILLLLLPCAFVVSSMELSGNQDLLCPRNAPSLLTLQSLPHYQLSIGLLQPFYVLAYNWDAPSSPLGCHDDDVDARQLVIAHAPWLLPKGIDPSIITCPWLEATAHLCSRLLLTDKDADYQQIASRFCQGTCKQYCHAVNGTIPSTTPSVLSSVLFNDLNDFRTVLTTELGLDPEAVRDIASFPSDRTRRLNHTEVAGLLEVPGPTPYKAQFIKYTNSEQSATLVEVLLSDGPAGKEGLEVLKAIRAVAQRPRFSDAGSSFVVFTDVDDILDMIEQVNVEAPPLLVGTTSVVTFIIAGLAFRSVLVPLRLLLTVVVTIIFVVGLSVWVYGTLIPVGGLYWIVPLSCGCLMIGLSLDYDVFLISEIYELRRAGYSTEAAILRAMGTESATITTAGLIMTVAFSSMLLSVTTVLNQWGLMLVATSLIDTFLVRSVLVPSLMFSFVEHNWWPGRMPMPTLHSHLERRNVAADSVLN